MKCWPNECWLKGIHLWWRDFKYSLEPDIHFYLYSRQSGSPQLSKEGHTLILPLFLIALNPESPSIYFPFTFLFISHSATKGKVHPPTFLLPDSFLIMDLQCPPTASRVAALLACNSGSSSLSLVLVSQGCLPPGPAWKLSSSAGQEPPHTPHLALRGSSGETGTLEQSHVLEWIVTYYCQWHLNTFESIVTSSPFHQETSLLKRMTHVHASFCSGCQD